MNFPWSTPHQSGLLTTEDQAVIPYLIAGRGQNIVIWLPGLSDGSMLATDDPAHLASRFHQRAKSCMTITISRRHPLPQGYTFEQQAQDTIWACEQLGVKKAVWECTSSGGAVGQIIAVQRPDLVRGLVLSSSLHRIHEHTHQVLHDWLELARIGSWQDYALSLVYYTYRPQTAAHFRNRRPSWLQAAGKGTYPERLQSMLSGLLELDHRSLLPDIEVPALVLGGQADRVVPAEIQREMADLITSCRIKLFPEFGHGNDLENPAYEEEVQHFLHRLGPA